MQESSNQCGPFSDVAYKDVFMQSMSAGAGDTEAVEKRYAELADKIAIRPAAYLGFVKIVVE